MQRKNNILMRHGIAMIMAITVIVIVATIMALALALTTKTTKKTTDMYLYEQSVLLSHSAAEYAMLKVSQQNAATPCILQALNFRYNATYDVNMTMRYITKPLTPCAASAVNTVANVTYVENAGDTSSDGTVILDIAITANPSGITEPIRYFNRSIQKM